MTRYVKWTKEDPKVWVWGKCGTCSRTGMGVVTGKYFAKAFPGQEDFSKAPKSREWESGQTCDNCGGALTELYRIERDDE